MESADQALSISVCAHICSSVSLVRHRTASPSLSLSRAAAAGRSFEPRCVFTSRAQGEHCRFDSVSETAIHGLADLLAACESVTTCLWRPSPRACLTLACCATDIGQVGSAAQAQAELTGRAESNLLDVTLALEAGSGEGPPPFAELLQLTQVHVAKLPANLLPGGPLSTNSDRPAAPYRAMPRHTLTAAVSSSAAAAKIAPPAVAVVSSGGREYREIAAFLPTLPPRHTFIGNDPPSLTPDPGSYVNEHLAQRQRTMVRRQVEKSLCNLRGAAVAENGESAGAVAAVGTDGTRTLVGLAAALQLSAMNERASRYNDGAKPAGGTGGIWGQEPLSAQIFRNNETLRAKGAALRLKAGAGDGGGGSKASKRKREEDEQVHFLLNIFKTYEFPP